eukprot:m.349277 g.349277  ORF g.349277 m.349277 type:complete len:122 (+) comp27950_c0_seq2:2646-3011(+)
MSQVAIGAIPTKHLGLKVAVKARPCTVPQSSSLDPPVVPISLKKSKRGRSATKASLRSTKSSSVAVGSAVPTRSSKALSKPATGREQMTSTDRQKKRSLSRIRHHESSTIPVARASKFDFE